MEYRIENDLIGEMKISADKYWGINTERAIQNFRLSGRIVNPRLIFALALVKKACALANSELGYLNKDVADAIVSACEEVADGHLSAHFPTDALQGGAGTSTNMNINEVIANRALELLGNDKGSYDIINPLEHVNLHQSTNDVFPTALKLAAIYLVRELSAKAADLQGALQQKEKEFAEILTIGRTELQDAVPMTLGAQFASFAEAIARDRWRTFKAEERLRSVNIGGTAIGTGLTAPKKYIFLVIEKLRQVSGTGLTRAEHVLDQTANSDSLVEVGGMLSAFASNLVKISGDLRLLHYLEEINLPAVQAGSTIMPGKVNPVICEAVIGAGMTAISNISLMTEFISRGTLQINEFMPFIADLLLGTAELLSNSASSLASHITGITANEEMCRQRFNNNITIITAFLPHVGYEEAENLINEYKKSGRDDFRNFLDERLGPDLVAQVLNPGNLMALGYRQI